MLESMSFSRRHIFLNKFSLLLAPVKENKHAHCGFPRCVSVSVSGFLLVLDDFGKFTEVRFFSRLEAGVIL